MSTLSFLFFLAQSDSGVSDFLGQISGLLVLTCGAGALWVILMALVMQRASERRRRAQTGQPPLPGIHVSAYRAVSRWLNPQAGPAARQPTPARAPKPRAADLPAPDLSLLTADLPAPDLAAMVGDAAQPVRSAASPVHTPEPQAAFAAHVESEFALDGEESPAPPVSEADAPAESTAATTGAGDVVEVLRVWRDVSDGSLILEMGGRRFGSLADLRSADLARRFQNVTRDLARLPLTSEGGPAALTAAQTAPGSPPPDAVELLRAWRDLADGGLIVEIAGQHFRAQDALRQAGMDRRYQNVVRDLETLAAAGATSPAQSATSPAPGSAPEKPGRKAEDDQAIPSMSPGNMFRQMTRAAMGHAPEPVEHPPERSIPDQIEDLLQERLAALPDYQDRSIHVRPSPEGGVRIEVDDTYYDGVGDVADEDVRALLMDVVRQWEQGQ